MTHSAMLDVHAALRRDVAALVTVLTDVDAPTTETVQPIQMPTVERIWALASQVWLDHHAAEAELDWPQLVARHPQFAEVARDLKAQHDELAPLVGSVTAGLCAFRTCTGLGARARQELSTRLHVDAVALAELLGAHLDAEEAAVLPLLATCFSPAECAELAERHARRIGLDDPDRAAWLAEGLPQALSSAAA